GQPYLDDQGNPVPSYDQTTVNELTRVLTGWNLAAQIRPGVPDYLSPMVVVTNGSQHDIATPRPTLFPGWAFQYTLPTRSQSTVNTMLDMLDGLNELFYHPNVGPFVGKQLIQHLVTSNPSPDYVGRIAAVFNDNGAGVRGDLASVVY